jgi:mono/diheme cytochrome c family protein
MRTYSSLQRRIQKSAVIGAMVIVLSGATGGPAWAQEDEVMAKGKRLYHRYCTVCHGEQGKGDGIMADQLQRTRPTDLTQAQNKHRGQFPFWRLYRIIDGREAITGHGPRDMPIWGDWFRIIEGQDKDAVRGRIWQLLYYLESIQSTLQ